MDLNRLTQGERMLAIAGGILLVLSFIPFWSKYEAGGFSQRTNAWSAAFPFYVKLALVLVIIGVALALIRAVGTDLQLPIAPGLIYVGTMGVATLLLLIAVLAGPAGSEFAGLGGVDISRGPLLFLSPLLAAAAAYGGYQQMTAEGSTPNRPGGPSTPPQQPPAS